MGSVAAANPPSQLPSSGDGLKVEALKNIDITHLSQIELQALSLCSSSSFDLSRTDDVVSPNVDRSLFNESAGSRRQTYSRLHHRSHFRLPGPHPSLKPHRDPNPSTDPVNHSIIYYLKQFMDGNHNPSSPPPLPPLPLPPPQAEGSPLALSDSQLMGMKGLPEKMNVKVHTEEKKRKRGRKNKSFSKRVLESRVVVELQKVNQKGNMVYLEELEKNGDEMFGLELKNRTVGLETEEDVLGFLRSLEGQWCSTRKKRKFVDSGMFGDALPIGWKILLGIRRRGFRPSIYCRRFISPTEEHFLSCQEAALFLKSHFGDRDAGQLTDQKSGVQQTCEPSTSKKEKSPEKTDNMAHDMPDHSATVRTVADDAREKIDSSTGIENLPEVQVQDIFECFKCSLIFYQKNVYLQHLLTFHQKSTKRCRVGTPVGEGVIIKDGKYECQFCHKVFEERRSYNGHVGVHVRNSGKISNEPIAPVSVLKISKSPSPDSVHARTSEMDALIEIAQSSIFETPKAAETCERSTGDQTPITLNLEEAPASSSNYETNVASDHVRIEGDIKAEPNQLNVDLNARCSQNMMETGINVNDDYLSNADIKLDDRCIIDSGNGGLQDIEKYGSSHLEISFGDKCLTLSSDNLGDTSRLSVGEIDFSNGVAAVPLAQSFQYFTSLDALPNKIENEFSVVGHKLENASDFEDLRFEDLDPLKYGFMNGEELPSLAGSSVNLGNNSGIIGFHSSVTFDSDVIFNALDANELTTVCVWCRTEFKLDSIESEAPSDSIGYMCPTCKEKISGHLHGGQSVEPHGF